MDPTSRPGQSGQALGLDEFVSAAFLQPRYSSNEDRELKLHHDQQREQRFQTPCNFEVGHWG